MKYNFLVSIIQNQIWFWGNLFFQYWFSLKVEGIENLPKDKSYLIVSNHCSHLDGPAIIAAQKKHMKYVYSLAAQDYFFNSSFKGWFCKYFLNMIPFKRRGKSFEGLKFCQNILAEGKIILMFPEGTRSLSGKIQPFKLGLGFLAMNLKVPIVPVYIHGSYQAMPKGKYLPRKHQIKVIFGSPLKIDCYLEQEKIMKKKKIYKDIVENLQKKIEQLSIIMIENN